jgi:YggT family protein
MDLIRLVQLLFELYAVVLFVRVMLSWIQIDPSNPLARIVYQLTEPLLAPIRQLLPQGGGLDFSPIVAFIALLIAEQIVLTLLRSILR